MSNLIWGFLVCVVALLIYAVQVYNRLVQLRNNVAQAWSNIDVLLKQRHDELPKLVETCKQYMGFEQQTLVQIMQARSALAQAQQAHDLAALGTAEGQLRRGLGQLFAVAEAYPELRSSEQFQHLQLRISGLESAIADRREFYNDSVNLLNVRIEQFPDLVIAKNFNFQPQLLLTFSKEETQDVDLKKLF